MNDQSGSKNETTPSDPNLENTVRILAQELQSKLIQLVVTNHVTPGADGKWDTTRGKLRLRPSKVAMVFPDLVNALANESTHAAQCSRTSGIGNKSISLCIWVDPVNTCQRELDRPPYRGPFFCLSC